MQTIVQAPPEVTFQQLREKLSALGDILTVDIDVRLPVD
jgi:hypothetical protein